MIYEKMLIKKIHIENFRTYSKKSFDFDDNINLIYGNNGIGKTNLLEAINLVCTGYSFKTARLKDCVNFNNNLDSLDSLDNNLNNINNNKFKISADVYLQGRDAVFNLDFNSKSTFSVNSMKTREKAIIKVITFTNDDLLLVKDYSDSRRNFLDSYLCQLRPKYALCISEYNKYLKHKNKILKDQNPVFLDMLDDYSIKMAEIAANIIWFRANFIKKLEEYAIIYYKQMSQNLEELSLEYKTIDSDMQSPKTIYPSLINHYYSHKQQEISAKIALSGPHRDDLIININKKSAKTYASRGQIRTAIISLKLAGKDIFINEFKEIPILLLDDILSDLDKNRRDFILSKITDMQVFITSPENIKTIACKITDL